MCIVHVLWTCEKTTSNSEIVKLPRFKPNCSEYTKLMLQQMKMMKYLRPEAEILSSLCMCIVQQKCPQPHTQTGLTAGFSGTTQVSWYQKGKTNLDFTEARDSEWQWHQLDQMQVCTSLQTTMPAPHHSVFYRPDALPATQPTVSKHWRQNENVQNVHNQCQNIPVSHKDGVIHFSYQHKEWLAWAGLVAHGGLPAGHSHSSQYRLVQTNIVSQFPR